MSSERRVLLFTTCLVDVFFPRVGMAVAEILERAGYTVAVPEGQTCCGQPAFNTGYWKTARKVASRVLELFDGTLPVILPSGSCATMVKKMYPVLFRESPPELEAAKSLSARVYEFSQFLDTFEVLKGMELECPGNVGFHDACHGLRELEVREGPRRLLGCVEGVKLTEIENHERCCGFGGTFTVKHPGLSKEMLMEKIRFIEKAGVEKVLALDVSCLMHIEGALTRLGLPVRTMHLAEFLRASLKGGKSAVEKKP